MQQLYSKVLEHAKYVYTVYTESKMNIDEVIFFNINIL